MPTEKNSRSEVGVATGSPTTAAEATYQLPGIQYRLGDIKGALED